MKLNIMVRQHGKSNAIPMTKASIIHFPEFPETKFFVHWIPKKWNRHGESGWQVSEYKYGGAVFTHPTKSRTGAILRAKAKMRNSKNIEIARENLDYYERRPEFFPVVNKE